MFNFRRKGQTFLKEFEHLTLVPAMTFSVVPHFQQCLLMSVFVTSCFRSYWHGYMVFHFCFVNMMGSMEWFLNIEEIRPSWKNSTLLLGCIIMSIYYWIEFCKYLIEDFCVYVHRGYRSTIFFLYDMVVRFLYQE